MDATIRMDQRSWHDLGRGAVSGLELFFRGALRIEGDLNDALELDSLFSRPPRSPWSGWHPRMRTVQIELPMRSGRHVPVRLAVYTAGPTDGDPVVFIHGLGASKVSLLPVLAPVARTHRVIAIDLPGFGHSDAPWDAPYTPEWLAQAVVLLLSGLRVRDAVLVGNSLGGRLAVEVGLRHPELLEGVFLLCPAMGFEAHRPIRRLLGIAHSSEAGAHDSVPAPVPWRTRGSIGRAVVDRLLASLLADPSRVPAANLAAARDDVLQSVAAARHRNALFSTARQVSKEDDDAFWDRVPGLTVPSCWVFGDSDVLVNPTQAEVVRAALPDAEVEVWEDTGHLPQFEHRHRTAERLLDFLWTLGQ